jgi:hypothetical protein
VLPDATHRGKQCSRSHGGTVAAVAGHDLLSEASTPGSATTCRWQLAKRGADTPAIFRSVASPPLPRGRPRLLTGR